jgi:hypothetical protein
MARLSGIRWIPALALGAAALSTISPVAHADPVAYLVNVTKRPGYNFPNPDAALQYGYGICDRVGRNSSYPDEIASIKKDFDTNDDYQAAYLINQAVNELCPALIWQLRHSAAHYMPDRSPRAS